MADSNTKEIEYSYKLILDDILEFPRSLKICVDNYFSSNYRKLFQEIKELLKTSKISRILFIGNDFNYFGSLVAAHCLTCSSLLPFKFSWESYEVSEFCDYILPKKYDDGTLYILISKSGQSRLISRIVEKLHLLKIDKNLIWFVTNSPDSSNAKKCGFVFPTFVETEVVHGTKTFHNTIFVLYLISELLLDRDPLSDGNFLRVEGVLDEMLSKISFYQDLSAKAAEFLGNDFRFLYFIFKGVSRGTAYNSVLLSLSLYRIFAEAISLGQILPRSFEVSDKNICCIFLVNNEQADNIDYLPGNVKSITDQLGRLILISNNSTLISSLKNNPNMLLISYQCEISALTPIFESVITQLILLEQAKKAGIIIS